MKGDERRSPCGKPCAAERSLPGASQAVSTAATGTAHAAGAAISRCDLVAPDAYFTADHEDPVEATPRPSAFTAESSRPASATTPSSAAPENLSILEGLMVQFRRVETNLHELALREDAFLHGETYSPSDDEVENADRRKVGWCSTHANDDRRNGSSSPPVWHDGSNAANQ